jgi:hypothetical protein
MAQVDIDKIAVSGNDDSVLTQEMRVNIDAYSQLIVDTSIFNTHNNKDDLKQLFIQFLTDLYIDEPEEVLNYLGQKPSNKLINNIFLQYGIDETSIKNYPELLKTKTAFLLNTLFETKGSVQTYELFNSILKEFYKDLNFYSVVVDEKPQYNKYEIVTLNYIYYMREDKLLEKYKIKDSELYPSPESIYDEDIEFKIFTNVNKIHNTVTFDIRLFEPADEDVYFKFDKYYKKLLIPRGETQLIVTKRSFDTTSITKYNNPHIKQLFYISNDSTTPNEFYKLEADADINELIDNQIEYNIIVDVREKDLKVKYTIDFGKPLLFKTHLRLDLIPDIQYINLGETKYEMEFDVTEDDLKDENDPTKTVRNPNTLEFRLEPVLINNPNSIITNVSPGELNSYKYLMNRFDFFDYDVDNIQRKNIFPIQTNNIYIQFGASVAIDEMKLYPDLVRAYSMTYLQDKVLKFNIGGYIVKLGIKDYMDILMYIKLRQVGLTSGWEYSKNITPSEAPNFYSFQLHMSKLDEIFSLLMYYQDMQIKREEFKEFRLRYNRLMYTSDQMIIPSIFNMEQYRDYLYGNLPDDLDAFFTKINIDFPKNVNWVEGKDQNAEFIKYLEFIRDEKKPKDVYDLLEIIKTVPTEDSNTQLSLHDMTKAKYIEKYPRLIQKIDALNNVDDIMELYLDNYKRATEQVQKMDPLIGYFINDTFQRFLMGSVFTERFFTPVLELFQQYFFKAEQGYSKSSYTEEKIKNKMNSVGLYDKQEIAYHHDLEYSLIKELDVSSIFVKNKQIDTITLNDNFEIEITDEDTNEKTTYTE